MRKCITITNECDNIFIYVHLTVIYYCHIKFPYQVDSTKHGSIDYVRSFENDPQREMQNVAADSFFAQFCLIASIIRIGTLNPQVTLNPTGCSLSHRNAKGSAL